MSKHALIITAYDEIDWLTELLELYSLYFSCYVHIDKKTNLSTQQQEKLNSINNVRVFRNYVVNWGSINHILAINTLLTFAYKEGCTYFHILSANTLPMVHPNAIINYFDQYYDNVFMGIKKNDGNSFDLFEFRYSAYFFQDKFNMRSGGRYIRALKRRVELLFAFIQRTLQVRKNVKFDWMGLVYCHFNAEVCKYILDYIIENPKYINELKRCYVGEEFYFQNIIMNSKFKNKVINDNKIYSIFSSDRGYPAFLGKDDLENIKKEECLFARKFRKNNDLFGIIRNQEKF